ncbi:unnamed protein product [Polarella glacialis]|uniref:Uncharacterized protein n=1 Tax=Polarella glacialis TaxID=89957 RepID=A0A813IW54_POLGL|nr:unnamed protein product [Polarella glacialis]
MAANDAFHIATDFFGDGATDSDLREGCEDSEMDTGSITRQFAAQEFQLPGGGFNVVRDRNSGNANPRLTQQAAGHVPIDYVPPLVRTSGRFVPAQFNTLTAIDRVANAMNMLPKDLQGTPSIDQVLRIIQSHHENVTRPEVEEMAIRVDTHMAVIDRAVMAVRQEFQFVAQEVRSSQLELARRQCVVGGFPRD